MDLIEAFKTIPYLLELNPDQIDSLSRISELIEIEAGESPIREGAALDFLYILLEGEIRVEIHIPTRGSLETSVLGPYDILGWSAMTPVVRQRTGTTTALTHCHAIRIDARPLQDLCEQDHEIGFYMYRRIANVTARSFLTTRLELMNLIVNI